ncbi:MAG: outer membrane protein assembly factor BamC [Halothiobacillus sp.]
MSQLVFSIPHPKLTVVVGLVLIASALSGCSNIPFISSGKPASRAATLEVPPAFTPPSPQAALAVPAIASARAAEAAARQGGTGVLVSGTGVKVMGGPESRYLAVNATPDTVWPKLQNFLQDEGYTVKKIEPGVGLMETDWTGSQAADQNGFNLMSFLSIVKNTFFKPDHIEKVRIRIEKGENNHQTLVFVTGQKMALTGEKPYFPGDSESSFKYADAKPDATLSAAMLARLTAYLSGKTEAESRAMMAATFAPRSQLVFNQEKDERYLVVSQAYPLVWNRLGLALDRLGFDPVKSNQKDGLIEVTHAHPQVLYADTVIRGAKIDPNQKLTLKLTLKAVPQKDGTTRIDVSRIEVVGGTLPEDRFAVLNKINQQME